MGVALIAAVAGIAWIAFQANSGLPLENREIVHVQVPDADRLIHAADVRIGGSLVGKVLEIQAVPPGDRPRPYARLTLALDQSVGPLPVDTTIQVRPASVLGLTYVDLKPGQSRQTLPAGGTLPESAAKASYDLTDLLDLFDKGSASAFERSVRGLGYGVAGRGTAINASIPSLASLLPRLRDVAETLAAPQTHLTDFISAYATFVDALTPVRHQLAALIGDADITFGALAGVRDALGAAIDEAPGAEVATTMAFNRLRLPLDRVARLATALRPAGPLLEPALQRTNDALSAGA
ncbi:MAG: phospholipid/cholesterol/gamma-HCH transport system substrate-binding protein, partial [Streptomyces sp.]|nr:phospholipid/cholesterol/gamma-HCH transport system substrate-binding protein [Streptomyces sp.]